MVAVPLRLSAGRSSSAALGCSRTVPVLSPERRPGCRVPASSGRATRPRGLTALPQAVSLSALLAASRDRDPVSHGKGYEMLHEEPSVTSRDFSGLPEALSSALAEFCRHLSAERALSRHTVR